MPSKKKAAKKAKTKVSFKARIGFLKYLPMHILEIPKKVVQDLGGSLKLRVICTVNEQVTFRSGLMALGEGRAYLSLTNKRLKELDLELGDSAKVVLEVDRSEFGMPVPEELVEVFRGDKEGHARFEKLTPGKQRYIIYYVSQVKNPELRLERATMLIENLKLCTPGKETFRQMLGMFD